MRTYPIIQENLPAPQRPVSFITIKFSDDFKYNINISECVHDTLNEFIIIDNTKNIFFSNLGLAINAGIDKAKHDLMVIVHEDVVLLPNWQAQFENSLNALEKFEPDWLVVGVVGWNAEGKFRGHLSDPHSYRDSLKQHLFAKVTRIDEQVLVLRKSKKLYPDIQLPSIHHIGRDLPLESAKKGIHAFVVNAPSIHKYADEFGDLIQNKDDSPKIKNRRSRIYLSDRACANEYIENKWQIKIIERNIHRLKTNFINSHFNDLKETITETQKGILETPVIFITKGGSGSRLITELANDIQLFIGNEINKTGDSLEMAASVYRAVIRKFNCSSQYQKQRIDLDLSSTAINMLDKANWPTKWGFKLPEALFILPELKIIFPNAKFVFLKRNPLSTALRRSHLTDRLDNQIGQITLPLAYDFFDLPRGLILTENQIIHNTRSASHQFELALAFKKEINEEKWLELKFENIIESPEIELGKLSNYLGMEIQSKKIIEIVDKNRALTNNIEYTEQTKERVIKLLNAISIKLGYL